MNYKWNLPEKVLTENTTTDGHLGEDSEFVIDTFSDKFKWGNNSGKYQSVFFFIHSFSVSIKLSFTEKDCIA